MEDDNEYIREEDLPKTFSEKIKEWHNLVVTGLCNGLTHTHRDGRNNDIKWVRRRLELFESFSRCVMDYEWGNNYKDFSEKQLKEISELGYKPTKPKRMLRVCRKPTAKNPHGSTKLTEINSENKPK